MDFHEIPFIILHKKISQTNLFITGAVLNFQSNIRSLIPTLLFVLVNKQITSDTIQQVRRNPELLDDNVLGEIAY